MVEVTFNKNTQDVLLRIVKALESIVTSLEEIDVDINTLERGIIHE